MPGVVQSEAYTLVSEAMPTSTPGTRPPFAQYAENALTTGGRPRPSAAALVSLALCLPPPSGLRAASASRDTCAYRLPRLASSTS